MTIGQIVVVSLLWLSGAVTVAGVGRKPASVTRRLAPFLTGAQHADSDTLSVAAISRWLWAALGHAGRQHGSAQSLAVRLERAGLAVTGRQFRRLQMLVAFLGLLVGAFIGVAWAVPQAAAVLLVVFPAVGVWVCDKTVTVVQRRRSEQVRRELPLVVEQLASLMRNGVGIGEACTDVARYTAGIVAADLARIAREIDHGVPAEVALQAWADRHDVDAIRRVVAVLDTHRHASDLGGLLAEEVRELRRSAHRDLLRVMQQREQQVWIPVTVATLVPGVLLLGVPFVHTLAAVLG